MRIRIKAITLAIALSSLILFMAGSINLAKANPYGAETEYTALPVITINSPVNNTTLFRDNVTLSITVTKPIGWLIYGGDARQMLRSISYQLDGKLSGPFIVNCYLESAFNYSIDLTNLEIGLHSLKVYADANGWLIEIHGIWQHEVPINSSSEVVYFAVRDTPKIVIMPIKNSSMPDVPLNFSTNFPTSKITYSLDNRENVTVAGNTTLTGLSSGEHNLTIYALDAVGNTGASETIFFTVAVPEVFPTVPVVAVVAIFVTVGLITYRRKRKLQKLN